MFGQPHFKNPASKQNEAALRQAAADGDLEQCQLLVRAGIDVNAFAESSKKTALHFAARGTQLKHIKVARYLVQSGAQGSSDSSGKTPCDYASNFEMKNIVLNRTLDALSEKTILLDVKEKKHYGVHYSPTQAMNIQNDMGPLVSAEQFSLFMKKHNLMPNSYFLGAPLLSWLVLCTINPEVIVNDLARVGINPNATFHPYVYDAYAGTALHMLLANEMFDCARAYIEVFSKSPQKILIDPTVQDGEGKTALLMCVMLKDVALTQFYLERLGPSSINIPDEKGRTPLHYAYLFGQEDMVKLLCDRGADEAIKDNEERTPIEMLDLDPEEIKNALLRFHFNPELSNRFNFEEVQKYAQMFFYHDYFTINANNELMVVKTNGTAQLAITTDTMNKIDLVMQSFRQHQIPPKAMHEIIAVLRTPTPEFKSIYDMCLNGQEILKLNMQGKIDHIGRHPK